MPAAAQAPDERMAAGAVAGLDQPDRVVIDLEANLASWLDTDLLADVLGDRDLALGGDAHITELHSYFDQLEFTPPWAAPVERRGGWAATTRSSAILNPLGLIGGNDVICGGDGNDGIRGRAGADVEFGENGDDNFFGDDLLPLGVNDPGNDTVHDGPGGDRRLGDRG